VSLKLSAVPVPGLWVWPALVARATVVAGGLIGREFGSRRAQLLALVVARIGRTRAQDRRGP
jgi:hypothetical protein